LSTTTPAANGTGSSGSSTAAARADHVHPTDTTRAAASHTHDASNINSGTLGSDRLPWASQTSRGAVKAYASGFTGYIYTS